MQADFSYATALDGAGMAMTATILADRGQVRATLEAELVALGFDVRSSCAIDEFASGRERALGDLVLVDCAKPDAAMTAFLARLDTRIAKSAAHLIVSTTMGALDAVFGCFAQAEAQILVDPASAERAVALGRVLASGPGARLRELGQEDRMMVMRLTEQVGQLAHRLEGLSGQVRSGCSADGGAFRLESPVADWAPQHRDLPQNGARAGGGAQVALPDAGIIRALIAQRQERARYFDADLFADPAWDILLDLSLAKVTMRKVCVTSLCIAANVPATTALRWIGQMVDAGLLDRIPDPHDRRRAHIALSDRAADAMARYFAAIGMHSDVADATYAAANRRITAIPVDGISCGN